MLCTLQITEYPERNENAKEETRAESKPSTWTVWTLMVDDPDDKVDSAV